MFLEESVDLGLFKKGGSVEEFQLPKAMAPSIRVETEFEHINQNKEHFYILSTLSNIFGFECQLENRAYCVMKAFQLATSIEDLCTASAETAFIFGLQKDTTLAQKMLNNSNFLAGKIVEPAVEGTLALQKGLFNITLGQWALSMQHLKQADCLFLTSGDVRKSDETNLSIAFIQLLLDQEDDAHNTSSRISMTAYKRQDNQYFLLSLALKGLDAKLPDDSIKLIDTVKNIKDLDVVSNVTMLTLLAQNGAQNRKIQESVEYLDKILEIFEKIDASSYWLYLSASIVPSIYEMLLGILKSVPLLSPTSVAEESSRRQLAHKIGGKTENRPMDIHVKLELGFKASLAFLQKFSSIFPFAEARVYYFKAVASVHDQKTKQAENFFKQSIAYALKFGVPYEAVISQLRLNSKNYSPDLSIRELKSKSTLLDKTM